jgi:hypothetical protein
MRSLIKNDPGIQYVDEAALQRERRRRRIFRKAIALACICMACYFVFQLLMPDDPSAGPEISLSRPKSVVTWFQWSFNSICVEIRDAVNGSLPPGNLAIVLKLILCFGLGALLLRMPQRY